MKINKWRMALLVWSAMFPFCTAMSYGLSELAFMAHWPLVARTFCLTCLLVPYMVCVALPFLNKRFQKWLQVNPPETSSRIIRPEQALSNQSTENYSETSRAESHEQYARLMTNGAGV